MASRKDKKGRVLRKGESYNEAKQKYLYTYTDPNGKRRSIYSTDLLSGCLVVNCHRIQFHFLQRRR